MRPISIIHVDEALMDRTTAVKHHLQAGKSVCPFARIIDLRDALIARGKISELSMPDQDLFRDCNIALGLVRCEPQARDEARIRVLCAISAPSAH